MYIGFINEKKCKVGLDFVYWELFGWLWFAIGRSHVSDRLPRPRGSKHVIRDVAARGEDILIKECEVT